MAFDISYFFLFGLITFISGKPANTEDYAIPSEIKTLLEELSNQDGKYDIEFSHHEDGPKSHHKDTARISNYDNSHLHGASHEKSVDYDNNPSRTNMQSLYQLFKNKPGSRSPEDNNFLLDQLLELHNDKTCTNAICKEWKWRFQRKGKYEYDTADEILEFLNELENNFEENGNYNSESRCSGGRCGRDKSDREESRDRADNNDRNKDTYNLRCKGNSCSRNNDDREDNDRSDSDSLRCTGDRCGRSRDDSDRNDVDSLRCGGDRCGANRDDKDDLRCIGDKCGSSRGDLRCSGDRCGTSRDDKDELSCVGDRCGGSRNDRDELSCVGDRCGRSRDDGTDMSCVGDRCGGNRDDDDRNDRDNLRCSGNRCGRTRDVNDDLRCRGKSCTRSRYYDDEVQSQLKARPILYKSNNDLDAVILDMSDLDRLLSNKNRLKGAKLLENVNLENLLSYGNANDKNSNIEAVVYDLEKRNDRDALAKQIKRLLMQGS